ncbi:hypothetical protein [Methylobacterium symbioticum]|uniref:hypothetical protein n=1 Tax=Methylobacterium symbioticum TaxID=2584084 RepID=UPI001626B350|nr:hypothetical protein [Methylobacterium symbioticum]
MRIICAAGAQRIPIHDDPANSTCEVGGFVQFARLGQAWAFTEVRHRWPEMVGE